MRKIFIILLIFGIFVGNLRFLKIGNDDFCFSIDEKCSAESMVVMERNSKRILYQKSKDKILPMASTTKIITAIVAIENCDDLDKKHEITKDMTGVEGSSIYLRSGEHLSIRELLYGLMLRSGNDSAVAIAKIISGSTDEFVRQMNLLCFKLGLTNTNIVTVNGLHDKNHYTSAYDLAKITCYALSNPVFAEIVSTNEKVISNELDSKNKCRFLKNKNKLLKTLDGADGVKTGYTMKAGRCFVGSATRDGMQLVCVVLNCREMFEESSRLINKAFNEYKLTCVQNAREIKTNEIRSKMQNLYKFTKNSTFLPLKDGEIEKLKTSFKFLENIEDDGLIGFEYFVLENDLIFSEKIYTILDEKKSNNNSFKYNFNRVIRAF